MISLAERLARRLPWSRVLLERPFLVLTVTLLLLLLLMPLVQGRLFSSLFLQLLFLDVLFVGLCSSGGWGHKTTTVLFLLWLAGGGLDLAVDTMTPSQGREVLRAISTVLHLLFVAGCLAGLVGHILRAREVTVELVFAALSAYLFMALLWSSFYVLLLQFQPQALGGALSAERHLSMQLIYFSLVTITTLGYGDLLPVTPFARMLASLEAVVGQFYLTVLVAWLVGMYVSRRGRRPRRD